MVWLLMYDNEVWAVYASQEFALKAKWKLIDRDKHLEEIRFEVLSYRVRTGDAPALLAPELNSLR